MKMAELPCEVSEVVEVSPVGGLEWWSPRPAPGTLLEAAVAADGDVVLGFGDRSVRARIVEPDPAVSPPRLSSHAGTVHANVVDFVGAPASTAIRLRMGVRLWSPGLRLESETLELGVTEAIVERCHKVFGEGLSVAECLVRLRDELLAEDGAVRLAAVASRAGSDELFLVGRAYRASFRKNEQGRWIMARLLTGSGRKTGELRLLSGRIEFVDATAMGSIRSETDRMFDALVDRAEGFLKLWRTYNVTEWQAAKTKAEAVGTWRYTEREQRDDGCWVFKGAPGAAWSAPADVTLDATDGLEAEDDRSEAGSRRDDDELLDAASAEGLIVDQLEAELKRKSNRKGFSGRLKAALRGAVVLDPGDSEVDPPPAKGWLEVSLLGDRVRLKRRLDAALVIRQKAAPMPTLGVLLEGEAPLVIERPKYSERSVQRMLKRLLPDKELNPKQFEAVMLALNTPDLALIQGPPGTGKTTVIAAIIACLAELESGESGPDIVVTSAQHEAVDNVARKTKTHSLPVARFDPRSDSEGQKVFIQEWQARLAGKVEDELAVLSPDTPLFKALSKAQQTLAVLSAGPLEPPAVADHLRNLFEHAGSSLPVGLSAEIWKRQESLRRKAREGSAGGQSVLVEKAIRRLPTLVPQFEDNGPAIAGRARDVLGAAGLLEPEDDALLLEASNAFEVAPEVMASLVPRLATLREALLDRLVVAPRDLPISLDGESMALVSRCVDELGAQMRQGLGGEAGVLSEVLDELESRPDAVEETIRNWTRAVGATVQHVANQGLEKITERQRYSTVVIDEAARAHPLDLLIPMVRAGRRIVLVGDHRQLPQMLDPDVERELLGDGLSREERRLEQILKDSLFEQLFATAGKSRLARTVTLGEQFRMHPVLGDFVSENFYPPEERFGSPTPASAFVHRLEAYRNREGETVPAVWLNAGRGQESKSGFSWRREAEAETVARHVERVLKDPNGRSLSVGVISFYGAQVELIEEKLAEAGILVRGEGGRYELSKDGAIAGEPPEDRPDWQRLKIGTVDAFQGREFDIVFLSVVRSNRKAPPAGDDADEEAMERWRRGAFGHLLLENRVNVAMSRQRRLLVVVGDRAQFEGEHRSDCVPGVTNFLRLCKEGRDGILLA